MLNSILSVITDSVCPGLIGWALFESWRVHRAPDPKVFPLLLFGFGLVLVYGLQTIDTLLGLWPRFGLDYSTHMAFAVMAASVLVAANPRWFWFACGILVSYALLMRYFGYHSFADSATTALVIVAGVRIAGKWAYTCQEAQR